MNAAAPRPHTSRQAGSGDSAIAGVAPPWRRRRASYVLILLALSTAVAGGWLLGRYAPDGTGPRGASAPITSPRPCAQACTAAYRVIAEALPHDRDNDLARAMLGAPDFDYLELDRALHVPTIAQIHAQWRRYCRSRYPGDSRAAAVCLRMIDSWRPLPVPDAAGRPPRRERGRAA